MKKAMTERLGNDADEASKALSAEKIPRNLIKDAMEIAQQQGGFTIFALVNALTKLSQKSRYAGDRTELDARIEAMNLAIRSDASSSRSCDCAKHSRKCSSLPGPNV